MSKLKLCRSFNPNLVEVFKELGLPKYQYGYKHIIRPQTCQNLIDKLDLKHHYWNSAKLDIVDVFSGYGMFSTMLNYELKPSTHVIIEDNHDNVEIWKRRIKHLESINGNKENFILYPQNGYNWSTYQDLIDRDKVIEPREKDRSNIHDELLIVGNLTTQKFGESLLAQWIMCSVYQNWLQKYGRVRIVCFVPDTTAQKFMSGCHFPKRNKSAIKREAFSDTKLVGVVESGDQNYPDGHDYDPNLLVNDQPVLVPSRSILPPSSLLAVLEIKPKVLPDMDFDMFEYLLQILMYKATGKVYNALNQLAPGAEADLAPKIPKHILNSCPRDLTIDEFLLVFKVFDMWPFKPPITDTIALVQEETTNL